MTDIERDRAHRTIYSAYKRYGTEEPDREIINEFIDIAEDYGISVNDLCKTVRNALKLSERRTDFDTYAFIVYGLIGKAKN